MKSNSMSWWMRGERCPWNVLRNHFSICLEKQQRICEPKLEPSVGRIQSANHGEYILVVRYSADEPKLQHCPWLPQVLESSLDSRTPSFTGVAPRDQLYDVRGRSGGLLGRTMVGEKSRAWSAMIPRGRGMGCRTRRATKNYVKPFLQSPMTKYL